MLRAALACLVILVGCGDPPPADAPPTEAAVRFDAPARDVRPGVRLDRILAASSDAAALVESLRPPRGQRAEPVANRHVAGQVDTVRTWAYDGLALEIYDVTGGPALVQRLTVTSGAYGTADGLAVGETRTALEETLGRAVSEADRVATYELDGALPTTVRVTYEPDREGVPRASTIEWRPPVE
ncbi:hypothetical protein [Rubrivirga sp.]|uniref:hypothetical protein n=1 Tax=Rubrivirga sp. TaxID=1885344 RepID=UPI003B515AED